MTTGSRGVVSSTVAVGVLIATSPVGAQQDRQNLSAEEVTSFLEAAEQDATQAMRTGDYPRLLDWTRDNIADGATFFVSQEIYAGDERKSFAVISLDKEDMLRLGRVAVGVMSGMPEQAVQDYSLDIEVISVDPVGADAATATTRIAESGKLALSRAASSGGQTAGAAESPERSQTASGEEASQEPGSNVIQVEATAQCQHLIRRGDGTDQLVIGMTTCQARARL